jgi:hypothetical protein
MGAIHDPSTKAELLALMGSERDRLNQSIEGLEDALMLEPALDGQRSIKDVLAHLTGWERRMCLWLRQSLQGLTPDRPAPDEAWPDLDALNDGIFAEYQAVPLATVRSDAAASYADALRLVEGTEEADLFQADRFAWRKGDPIWHLVADNTFRHYREHREQIQTWLAGNRQSDRPR